MVPMPESAVSAESSFEARLVTVRYAAREVNTYEFARPDGATLMDVEPGAHIDIALPNGITLTPAACTAKFWRATSRCRTDLRASTRLFHPAQRRTATPWR